MDNKIERVAIHFIGGTDIALSVVYGGIKDVIAKIDNAVKVGSGYANLVDVETKAVYCVNGNNITYIEREHKKEVRKRKSLIPSIEEVREYARERDRMDLAEKFYKYYNDIDWKDMRGARVVNWKLKFCTWEKRTPKPEGVSDKTTMVGEGVCEL